MARTFSKNYAAWIEATYESHAAIDKVIAAIQNVYNMTRWDAISYLFKIGTEVGIEYVEKEADRQDVKAAMVKSRLLDLIRKESRYDDEIRRGMTELGVDRIMSMAKAEGMPEGDVHRVLEKIKTDVPYTSAVGEWLEMFFSDYKAKKVEEVKEAAFRDGMLPPKEDPSYENRWATIRSTASRLGLSNSGKWGEWQKKLM